MAVSYPRQFGKYVLLKPLAKGGMGEIYVAALGQIDGFDKLCVIKKVIPEKSDEGKAKRFLDEAKVVLRLAHSGLVNTFDAGQVDREFYIAMEMVEGKDLREVWNRCVRVRHRIPIEVALHVARDVARALFYVHTYGELNLVHRDVAPPNIMLAYNGDVKLTDFGLARSALKQEHTQPGVVFGRAAYLAPEQARGEVADPGTDVYSLAVVLWELLTGHQYLQIAGLDPAAALAMVRHPKPMPPSMRAPWVTPSLDAVLMRALSPDRGNRYTTAEEFRLALSEAIVEAAPRTDAARVSELMHAIYNKAISEEAAERERFLKEVLPAFRASTTPPPVAVRTPPPLPLSRRSDDNSSRRSIGKMPRMAAPAALASSATSSTSATPSSNDPEARKRTKRDAALGVLAELAAADDPVASRK
jgi:serine/threonine protein kinase